MFHVFFFIRLSDNADMNGEDTSSSSSEEEKEGDTAPPVNGLSLKPSWTSMPHSNAPQNIDRKEEEYDEEEESNCLPTIFFSHTVEPKKVRAMRYSVFCSFLVILPFNPILVTLFLSCFISFFCCR